MTITTLIDSEDISAEERLELRRLVEHDSVIYQIQRPGVDGRFEIVEGPFYGIEEREVRQKFSVYVREHIRQNYT